MDSDNAWCLTGWQEINGKKYYFDPDNAWMLTGRQEIDGKLYVFGDDGALQTPIENQPADLKPSKTETETKLTAVDREVIENDLKPYIQSIIKAEIAKEKQVIKCKINGM